MIFTYTSFSPNWYREKFCSFCFCLVWLLCVIRSRLSCVIRSRLSQGPQLYSQLYHSLFIWRFVSNETVRGCLVCVFKQPFSVFKQHFTHFNTFFHLHVFPQIFLNNNFHFLNIHTKRTLNFFFFNYGLFFFLW